MLKVNLASGRTLTVDLQDPEQYRRWRAQQSTTAFQRDITGIGIYLEGHLFVIPVPVGFGRGGFSAELIEEGGKPVGERVVCQADEVRVSMNLLWEQDQRPQLVRIDLRRIGRPIYQRPGQPAPQELAGRRNGRGH